MGACTSIMNTESTVLEAMFPLAVTSELYRNDRFVQKMTGRCLCIVPVSLNAVNFYDLCRDRLAVEHALSKVFEGITTRSRYGIINGTPNMTRMIEKRGVYFELN